jgi:EmrB/QacA subfamily drug resistance transporter
MLQPSPSRLWFSFFLVAIGVFMATMDSSMVNVALPTIMRSFGATLAQAEWVALIYLLTITVTLLIWGRLADRLGKRKMYLLGMLVFGLGSAACSVASTLLLLVVCRFVQAAGASMMMSSGPAIIKRVFPAHQLGRALGLIGVATSLGLMSGPVISGLLIRVYSWRALFLVTVPISLICFAVGWFRLLPASPLLSSSSHKREPFDCSGLLLWALVVIITALLATHYTMWSGTMRFVGLCGIAGLFILLIVVERRAAEPLFPFALFRERHYAIAMICAALSFTVLFVVLILVPFYLDYVLGVPVDRIGLVMMAVPAAVFVVAPFSGWLYDRTGARILTTAGLALCCLALILLCLLDARSGMRDVAWRLAMLGAGQALFLSPNSASVLATAPLRYVGITSGMLATVRNLGMLAGVTLAGVVFGGVFSWLSGGLDVKDFTPAHVAAFITALRISFGLAAILALVGVILSGRRG